MTRRPDAEARETALIAATRAQFSTLSRAILTGDRAATKRLTDALGDYIVDDQAAGELVRATLTDASAMRKLLTDLMWAEAGELAEKEVQAAERRRAEESASDRAMRWLWDRGVLA